MSAAEIGPAAWLAAVADTDENPAVREVASVALAELLVAEQDARIVAAVRRDHAELRRAADAALLPPYARGRLDALDSILRSV